jgi:hypothetical protein
MGNTKTYYIEGELLPEITLESFKSAVYDGFHSTYCVAEIVEKEGGYLGTAGGEGPYLVAAIHSYSQVADSGPKSLFTVFKNFRMHRVDSDWADCWIAWYDLEPGEGKKRFQEWRAHDSKWIEEKGN